MPTHTTMSASSVQYVDRTERILVNSDRTADARPAWRACVADSLACAPLGRGWSTIVVAISGHLSCVGRRSAGSFVIVVVRDSGAELHARCSQLHERLLERRGDWRQFVQADVVLESQVTKMRRV